MRADVDDVDGLAAAFGGARGASCMTDTVANRYSGLPAIGTTSNR